MRLLGIVRGIDSLGRVVIPKEFRNMNGWGDNQLVEMLADNDGGLYIRPYGKNEEKREVLDQLEHIKTTTVNDEVLKVVNSTIEFLKKQG